jgi:hypothetical protein
MSASYLLFQKINSKKSIVNEITLLDHIDMENDDYKEYYCANAVEKLFECNNILTYIKRGGFGLNYRYCASCYYKWNEMKRLEAIDKDKMKGKCLIDVSKL